MTDNPGSRGTDARVAELSARIRSAAENNEPLIIVGGGTKAFYGRPAQGTTLSTRDYAGVLSYEPSELVITVRSGTLLSDIHEVLAERRQRLAFEPPEYGPGATIGGAIAAGLSGPGRPFTGGVRDMVLGVTLLNGDGEVLKFGGQVMKNVAGYDVTRLMTGAMGTLGLLLDLCIRVAPLPAASRTLVWKTDLAAGHQKMLLLARQPWPLTGLCYCDGAVLARLAGHEDSVAEATRQLQPDEMRDTDPVWLELQHQTHAFFRSDAPLWRLSVPPAADRIPLDGDVLYEWGGGCRWLLSHEETSAIRQAALTLNGHATAFRHGDRESPFTPLDPVAAKIHTRLKSTFDPKRIFNRGRMYAEL